MRVRESGLLAYAGACVLFGAVLLLGPVEQGTLLAFRYASFKKRVSSARDARRHTHTHGEVRHCRAFQARVCFLPAAGVDLSLIG